MKPLNESPIAQTDVRVTRLGLGSAPFGGWPDWISRDTVHDTVEAAWDLGLRYYDTAPAYGYGQAERWVGEVLRHKVRDDYTLSTKVGRLIVPTDDPPDFFKVDHRDTAVDDYSAAGARRSIEESLERLGVDRIDIALVHDPDDSLDEALDGALSALADMKSEGMIGAIGAGMNWADKLTYLAERADLDCVLLAGRYSLLEQDSLDDLLPIAEQRGISILAGGVFNSGLLADPRPGGMYNYAPAPEPLVRRALRIKDVCDAFDVPIRAAAIQFPLAHPTVATVLVGARAPGEITENHELAQRPIPAGLWARLKDEGLMRPDAPTPDSH